MRAYAGVLGGMTGQSSANDSSVVGLGIGFTFGAALRKIPLAIGIDFLPTECDESLGARELELYQAQKATVDLTYERTHVYVDVWTRLLLPDWVIRPFIEGSLGLRVEDETYAAGFRDGGGVTRSALETVSSRTYGYGGGLELAVTPESEHGRVYLTFGFRRMAVAAIGAKPAGRPLLGDAVTLATLGIAASF